MGDLCLFFSAFLAPVEYAETSRRNQKRYESEKIEFTP